MTQKQIPGYTRSGAYWYLDADGTGPYGVDNTGAAYLIGAGGGGGGGSGSPGIDGILVQDSTLAQGILRTIDTAGVITTQYVHFDGTPWTPSLPVTAVNTSAGMATSSNQAAQITAEQAIQAGVGAPGDAAPANDSASGSLTAYSKRLAARMTSLITQSPLGAALSAAARPVAIATDDAQFGAEATGFTPSAGATGLRGRLSEISTAARAVLTSLLTVVQPDVFVASSTISVLNANPTSGVPTANSTISVALNGQNVVAVCVTANNLGASATLQVSYDNATWKTVLLYASPDTNPPALNQTGTIGSATLGKFLVPVAGAKAFRISANTATVSGSLTATLNASVASTPIMMPFNLASYGAAGAVAAMTQTGGTASASLAVVAANATSTADYNGVSWAAASGSGATIADSAGAVCAFDVNLSVWSAGSSVGLDAFVDISKDGGTTWDTIWQCEALTAIGHVSTPALAMNGARRRMRWVNRGGVATTATVTANANRISIAPAKVMRQFFDRTSTLVGVSAGAVSAGATTTGWINAAAVAGAGYETGGASSIAAIIPALAAATTAPTYQLQVCSFNSTNSNDWVSVGAALQASITAATRLSATGITERYFRVICTVAGAGVTGSYIALTAS